MDPAKSNNRYCCCVPWAGDGGLAVHESLGSQLLPEKNVQGGKDVLVCPCVCFWCHCKDNARLMLRWDLSMAAALQKQLGKSENLLVKNLVYLWWRQMQTRPFVAVGKPEINGSNERHRAHEQTCFVSFGGVMTVVQQPRWHPCPIQKGLWEQPVLSWVLITDQ